MDRCNDSARSAARGPRGPARHNARDNGRCLRARGDNSGSFRMGRSNRSFRKEASAPPSSSRPRDGDSAGIRVTVRFRPLSRKERSRGDTAVWGVDEDNNVGRYQRGAFSPKYRYDTVFTEDRDNQFVYTTVAGDIVDTAMGGVNGTVFAYGVTSSGKTHTMMGNKNEAGMIPLTMQHVFDQIEQNPDKEYLLKLSMLEIYNEELNDLLDPVRRNLKIREDRTKGVHVDGQTEVVLESVDQALSLIYTGIQNRQVSGTNHNAESSRSHTLCRISIEAHDKSAGRGGRTFSFLNLIDLAGSESAKAAKSKGHRMEGSFINKSLLTLGTVIHKLSEAKKKSHIPFRDSKLTRLLQSSLTGNGSKMAIICCVTPSSAQAEETENTLKFAERAKKVKIKRTKNEMMDSRSEIAHLHRVIADLKTQLKEMIVKAESQPPASSVPDPLLQEELSKAKERLEEELRSRIKREEERHKLEATIQKLTRLILHSTRAQTGNMVPNSRMHRSHSFDALKAKSALASYARRSVDSVVVHSQFQTALPPEVREMKSSSSVVNPPLSSDSDGSPVAEERAAVSSPKIRSPTASRLALPGNAVDEDTLSENEFLRKQLFLVRQSVVEREKELATRNREFLELKQRVYNYEQNSDPPTARSHVAEDNANMHSLEFSLLEADRGVLEESLIAAKKDKERLTAELLKAKIELKRTKKKLHEYEGAHVSQKAPAELLFRSGAADNVPTSPTGSASTIETGTSDVVVSPGRHSDERPPRHPPQPQAPGSVFDQNVVSPTECRAKLARLEAEVRCALHALTIKDNQIESQRREIVSHKEETDEVKQLLKNLGSENEGLKQRIKLLEAQQHRMQGYLLDAMPTTDLYALRAEIKDASHRLERAAYSRRISSIPALSFDEMDSESTRDLYVSKGLDSAEA